MMGYACVNIVFYITVLRAISFSSIRRTAHSGSKAKEKKKVFEILHGGDFNSALSGTKALHSIKASAFFVSCKCSIVQSLGVNKFR